MFLGTLVSDFRKAGGAIKSFLVKIADGAPAVVATIVADEEKIAPVIEAFIPGSAAAFSVADSLLNKVAQAIEDAGPAATANGLQVSLDQAIVKDIEAIIAAAKAAFSKGAVSPTQAPVANSVPTAK